MFYQLKVLKLYSAKQQTIAYIFIFSILSISQMFIEFLLAMLELALILQDLI